MPRLVMYILLMQTKKYIIVLSIDLFIVGSPPLLVVISAVLITLSLITQVVMHTSLIRTSHKNLISLCQPFDLHDTLRIKNAYSSHFTWHGSTVASRLDRFYVSTAVNVNLYIVQAVAVSDHSFFHIFVIIQQNQSFGPGFWKNIISFSEDTSCYDYIVSQ